MMQPTAHRPAGPSPSSTASIQRALGLLGPYRHVIWDWNGTLFDDVNLCVELISQLLDRRGLPALSLEKYRDIFTFPVRNYYVAAGLDFGNEPFEIVGREWMDSYERRKHECPLHLGTVELLKQLASRRVGQSILSAYSQHTLEQIVAHHGLLPFFQHLYGLDNIYAASKVVQGRKLMARLGHGPGQVVLIGDTIHDFEVAREIGADCLLVAHGHQSHARLASLGVPILSLD